MIDKCRRIVESSFDENCMSVFELGKISDLGFLIDTRTWLETVGLPQTEVLQISFNQAPDQFESLAQYADDQQVHGEVDPIGWTANRVV